MNTLLEISFYEAVCPGLGGSRTAVRPWQSRLHNGILLGRLLLEGWVETEELRVTLTVRMRGSDCVGLLTPSALCILLSPARPLSSA
jgi:hypothetical protein